MSLQETSEAVVRKTVIVGRPPEEAFRIYTKGIATWWPLGTHSVAEENAETVVLEERDGGRFYERTRTGEEHEWGVVLAWEPPRRLVHTWHPGRGPETAQEVEIHFHPEGSGTRIELEHRGWEVLGDRATEMIQGYDKGWDFVLGECYGGAAVRSVT